MTDIEDEFKKLMQEAIDKVNDKMTRGEYDLYEAQTLIDKVNNCIDHGDESRCGFRCPEGHTDPDCGWSPSMGYHCL